MNELKINQGRAMRGKRVLVHTCIGHVLTRFMRELNLTYRELYELTGVSKSTLHGWCQHVVMENPDVLIILKKVFTEKLKREVTTDELLFGIDEDRERMKEVINKQEATIKELTKQLALFEIAERML